MEKSKIAVLFMLVHLNMYSQKDSIRKNTDQFKINYNVNIGEIASNNSEKIVQHNLRTDFKGYYASLVTEPINIISVGKYQRIPWSKETLGILEIKGAVRFRGQGGNISLRYTHWWKRKIVPFLGVTDFISGRPNDPNGSDVYVLTAGGIYAINDRKMLVLSIFQDFSNSNKTVASLRYKYVYNSHAIELTGIFGSQNNNGIVSKYHYKKWYIQTSYFKNIDFSQKNQWFLGIGRKITL